MTSMTCMRSCLLSALLLCYVFDSCFFTIDALFVGLGACRSDQIQALMEFKNEFDSRGCDHTDFVNGVRCNNATGAIKKLQLPPGCLRGTLKPNSSLFKLHHLRFLNLSNNVFTFSELPSGFGNLNNLEVLSLSSNGFLGQVPSSFSNLSQLSCLDLSHNELTGNLQQVGNLSKLSYLRLYDNMFSEDLNPNSSLFRLHNLRFLSLAYNEFTSSALFSGFENLNRLEVLDLSYNDFVGQVPSSFSNLSQLSILHLEFNKLTGSFPLVQNLTKLSVLWLSNNNFTGTLPPYLFTMPLLSYLHLRENQFSGPIEIPNSYISSSLEGLVLGNNHFDTQILEPISKLITLKYLDLSFLKFSYKIDFRIFSSLKSLSELDLSGNSLSPTSFSSNSDMPLNLEILILMNCQIQEFPKTLTTLQDLKGLFISENKIEGKVPEWLWSLPRLTTVDLRENFFIGFEGSAQALMNSSVQSLALDFNRFQGEIPILPLSINILSASYNNFSGNIPLSVCNRKSFKFLDLSFNNFTGPIPQCLGNFEVVGLRQNNLEGSLPDMFYVGSLVRTLDVGYNRLTGKLPRSLVNCSSLKFLSVDNNKIEDTFPFWLKTSTDLQVLILRSNRFFGQISPDQDPLGFSDLRILEISDNNFTGNLPASYFENWKAPSLKRNELGRLYLLEAVGGIFYSAEHIDLLYKGLHMEQQMILSSYSAIDLSGNKIEGQIPESIGQVKTLIALNLSNNAFTGHIPLSLGNAIVLESLDMSRNQLSGSIPNGLGALSSLAYINVSHNQLKGEIPQGTQIVGQLKSSFEGNAGLCGLPLEQNCFDTSTPPTQHHMQEDEEEIDEEVLNWKAVIIGYASGVLLGMTIGKVFASYKSE